MKKMTDEQLIQELMTRFKDKQKMFNDLEKLTEKLIEVNQKLTESEMVKSHFLSNIRNEINNPLTSILGLSENIKKQPGMDKNLISKMAGMIYKEAFYLDFQFRTIFAGAELEAGECEPHISKVDIPEVIYRTIDLFKENATDKGIEITFQNKLMTDDGSNFIFNTDAEKLHLIFSHLLDNAIEYSDAGTKVNVLAQYEDNFLNVSVKDNGMGIKESVKKEIFNRFVQLHTGSTKEHKGQGLGLSVVKDFLDLLNGEIKVESEEGKGSTFTILIPENEIFEDMDDFSFDGNEELF